MKPRWLLLAYALMNAVLYSMLLPLWEGFDEPFHFGYVQYLANGNGFPDPRTSRLSQEVGSSLSLAPASLWCSGTFQRLFRTPNSLDGQNRSVNEHTSDSVRSIPACGGSHQISWTMKLCRHRSHTRLWRYPSGLLQK